jgi:hypothetical protein
MLIAFKGCGGGRSGSISVQASILIGMERRLDLAPQAQVLLAGIEAAMEGQEELLCCLNGTEDVKGRDKEYASEVLNMQFLLFNCFLGGADLALCFLDAQGAVATQAALVAAHSFDHPGGGKTTPSFGNGADS